MLNKDQRILGYQKELAPQFILRLPDGPAKTLKELLRDGDDLSNRLTIQFQLPTKYGKVRLDNWDMRAEIIDLPIITDTEEDLKKGPEISQILICKLDKKKLQKKEEEARKKRIEANEDLRNCMWPHGVLPPSLKRLASTSAEELEEPANKVLRKE